MDLYSIGELVIDFTPGNEPASYIRNPGGAPGNAAIAAARSGLSVGVCSSVGEDDFGHFLAQTMRGPALWLRPLQRRPPSKPCGWAMRWADWSALT